MKTKSEKAQTKKKGTSAENSKKVIDKAKEYAK